MSDSYNSFDAERVRIVYRWNKICCNFIGSANRNVDLIVIIHSDSSYNSFDSYLVNDIWYL